MLTDLNPIEQRWLRDGMTEDLIEQIRNDPTQLRFALSHLENAHLDELDERSNSETEIEREGSSVKTIELLDHELAVTEFSHFELKLQARKGKCTANYENFTSPQGTAYIRLGNPVIEFEDTPGEEEQINELLKVYGFQRENS